jgi:AmmeMemoRadiSam system protein B
MPSPIADRPGLLIHDPYRFSSGMMVVPPALAPLLALFDGEHTVSDLRMALVEMTGEGPRAVEPVVKHLTETLSSGGFFEDESFLLRRDERILAFASATTRTPAHAGNGYPADAPALAAKLDEYLGPPVADTPDALAPVAIAAPHVSPDGGWHSYRAAYRALGRGRADRTFVILGTSHYGEPDRFGLTRKPFSTPLGEAAIDQALVDRLADEAGDAVRMEDYAHAIEHSVEFQVIFLQRVFGPGVRIVPVLCGPFAAAMRDGGRPEDTPRVARMLDALKGIAASEALDAVFVLGVDMAHVGRRYGDRFSARVGEPELRDVAAQDRARIACLEAGDAHGFWDLVRRDGDPLKWCGASALYTFLAAVPGVTGELLHYEQWNIDEHSVVSFAGLAFHRGRGAAPQTKGHA